MAAFVKLRPLFVVTFLDAPVSASVMFERIIEIGGPSSSFACFFTTTAVNECARAFCGLALPCPNPILFFVFVIL